jgi:hypothetical protein
MVAEYAFVRPASPVDLAQLHKVGFSYSVKHKRQEQQLHEPPVFASELERLESDIVSVSGRSDCSHQPELPCL